MKDFLWVRKFLVGVGCVALGLLGGLVPTVAQHKNFFGKIDVLRGITVPNSDEDTVYWANKIASGQGKYILWFRHGEREKWTGTVTVFDFFDTQRKYGKFETNWKPAVCLTDKGIAESQIVGKTFSVLKIRVSTIVSSPSCRAKETALLAFNRIDYEWLEVLHPTALTVEDQILFKNKLKNKLDNLVAKTNWNQGVIVVTGHGNTLPFYKDTLFYKTEVKDWAMNELGFTVIEVTKDGLIARHTFIDFYEFANAVLKFS